jgi:hypothetical protein
VAVVEGGNVQICRQGRCYRLLGVSRDPQGRLDLVTTPDLTAEDAAASRAIVEPLLGLAQVWTDPQQENLRQLLSVVEWAARDIDAWLRASVGSAWRPPAGIRFTTVPGQASEFDLPTRRIVVGLEAPWDGALAHALLVLAHEYGHALHEHLWLTSRSDQERHELELHADCIAGAWMADAHRRGILTERELSEAGIRVALFRDGPTHPPVSLRVAAFARGSDGLPGRNPLEICPLPR